MNNDPYKRLTHYRNECLSDFLTSGVDYSLDEFLSTLKERMHPEAKIYYYHDYESGVCFSVTWQEEETDEQYDRRIIQHEKNLANIEKMKKQKAENKEKKERELLEKLKRKYDSE